MNARKRWIRVRPNEVETQTPSDWRGADGEPSRDGNHIALLAPGGLRLPVWDSA